MGSDKSAVTSIGVMGPAIGIVVYLLNQYVFKGNILQTPEAQNLVDLLSTVWITATGIYGRWRATQQITGIIQPASKVSP